MKILLSLIICSSVAQECMPPFPWNETFSTQYDCLHFGYEESQKKLELLDKLSKTGLKFIEMTAFVSPKWIPALYDHEKILELYKKKRGYVSGINT